MSPGRQKVEDEGRCRHCGLEGSRHLDAAHLWPRGRGASGFEDVDNIVPLCSNAKGGAGCHQAFDAHRLDLLEVLTLPEQVRLVQLAGGLERARDRAIGKASREATEAIGPF